MISVRATQALLGVVGDKTVRRPVKAGPLDAVRWAPGYASARPSALRSRRVTLFEAQAGPAIPFRTALSFRLSGSSLGHDEPRS